MADGTLPACKVCSKCRESKPLSDFHSKAGAKGGRCPSCKACYNTQRRASYTGERREEIKAYNKQQRVQNRERHLDYDRRRAPLRVDQRRERGQREWAALTPEQKALKRAEVRAWKAANPDKVRAIWERTYARHREKRLARIAEWARANPVARAAIRDRRRAREVGAIGDYTPDDVSALLTKQGRQCRYCNAKLTKFHVDHFIPLSRGGMNSPENLVLSCPTCNFRKGAKMPWEWMPERFPAPEG